jgi:hypothetical protein
MDAQIIIDCAKRASTEHSTDSRGRLAFQVGYLESSVYELCDLVEKAEKVMIAQKEMIERLEKGISASL